MHALVRLDDPGAYNDPAGFLGMVETLSEQLRAGWKAGSSINLGIDPTEVHSVAVLGMGGSGVSGDVLGAVVDFKNRFAGTVKDYELPGWVGPDTLTFAVSYSGNTEETLEAYSQAAKAGSPLVCVTTGGKLAELAGSNGHQVAVIPTGLPPRAALGYLVSPMLAVIESAGLGRVKAAFMAATELVEQRSQEWGSKVASSDNLAKQWASSLVGTIPIIYGSAGLSEVAAYRWKCQLNECSKVPSYHHALPELDHNEIVGFRQLKELTSKHLALVLLRHAGEAPRVQLRFRLTLELVRDHFASVKEFTAAGQTPLERFFDLVYFGDFVATYLAFAQGVDPAEHLVLEDLKSRLASER